MRDDLWTSPEIERLCRAYAAPVPNLDALAKQLGRHKTNVCRKARELGLTSQQRPKKLQLSLNYTAPLEPAIRNTRTGARIKAHIAANGHPRGALGMKHSPETLAALSAASKRAWARPESGLNSEKAKQRRSDLMHERMKTGAMRPGGYSRGKGGRRADLDDRYFRSSWEANYARYLNWLKAKGEIAAWEFEAQVFDFVTIKRGQRSYLPDFKVVNLDGSHEWHEVKGWLDPKSKTKLARMAKFFPGEKVVLRDAKWFRAACRSGLSGMIGNWEGRQ